MKAIAKFSILIVLTIFSPLFLQSQSPPNDPTCGTVMNFEQQRIFAQSAVSLTEYTLESWIKPESANSEFFTDVASFLQLRLSSFGGLEFYDVFSGVFMSNITHANVLDGNWHHVAIVKTATIVFVYLDGAEIANATYFASNTRNHDFVLGGSGAGPFLFYDGQMDEVRVWSNARTALQVQTAMDQSYDDLVSANDLAGIEIYYDFSEGIGSNIIDLTGGNNARRSDLNEDEIRNQDAWLLPDGSANPQLFSNEELVISEGTTTTINGQVYQGGEQYISAPIATANSVCDSIHTIDVKFDQTINFNALANAQVGTDVNLMASTTSPLPISYSSSNTAVATVSGNTLTILAVGSTDITASQVGDLTYAQATDVVQSLTAVLGDQTITFDPIDPQQLSLGQLALGASSTSELPITYTSSDPSVASISGGMATFHQIGSTEITASQSGDANYNPALDVTQTLEIIPSLLPPNDECGNILNFDGVNDYVNINDVASAVGTSTDVSFGFWFNTSGTATGSEFLMAVNTSTGGNVVLVGISGDKKAIVFDDGVKVTSTSTYNDGQWHYMTYVKGGTSGELFVDGISVGSHTTTFSFSSNDRWSLAQEFDSDNPSNFYEGKMDEVTVWTKALSSMNIGSLIDSPVIGNETDLVAYFDFNDGAGSTLTDLVSGNNGTLTSFAVNTGWTKLDGSAAEPNSQEITFEAIPAKTVLDDDFGLTATSNLGLPITYASSDANVAIVNGSTVEIIGSGMTTITANQEGTACIPAVSEEQILNVSKIEQVITFDVLEDRTLGDPDFDLTATGGASGNPITFSSSDETVATISGNSVTLLGAGTITITASQLGNSIYSNAMDVELELVINKIGQIITFEALEPKTFGDATFDLIAVGGDSGNPVIFDSSDETVATISENTVTIIGAGSTTITASQEGNDSYDNAIAVGQLLTIEKADQTINFEPELVQNAAGTSTYLLQATATSSLPVTYALDRTSSSIATLDGDLLTLVGPGIARVKAEQAGNENYDAANSLSRDIQIIEQYIWNGTSWNSGSIPTDENNVEFAGDYNFDGVFLKIDSMHVASGITVTIDQLGALEVFGNLTNDGNIIVESGSSLITYEGKAIIGNDITIKRNTRYADGKYSFVGTPVKQDASITGADLGDYVYKYNETISYGSNDGLNRWEDASSDELLPGVGYAQANQQEILFVGKPNDGTIIRTGTYTEDTDDDNEGWNLISNPYAAPIHVSTFLAINMNLSGAVYIWDDNGSDTQRGSNADYIVANGIMATNTTLAGGETRYNQRLGSSQGFFVKLNDDNDTDITFTEFMRDFDGNSDENFFRKTTLPIIRVNLTNEAGLFKQAVIGIAEDASAEKLNRTYDAPSFNASVANGIFTQKANQTLALNGQPGNWSIIDLQVNTEESGSYTISVVTEDHDGPIFLKDHVTNQVVDLTQSDYPFYAQSRINNDRFELLSNPNGVLSIEEEETLIYAHESKLYIHSKGEEKKTYQLVTISGKELLSIQTGGRSTIDLSHLSKGIYLVFDGEESHKIILN